MKFHPVTTSFLFLLFFESSLVLQAQEYKWVQKNDINVFENGRFLAHAWAGGLDNPQFSEADLNNDGILDLVIFDRSNDEFYTFLNGGTQGAIDYTYAPEYEAGFPEARSYALLRDYNCDGASDLFYPHVSNPQIVVSDGYFDASGKLNFRLPGPALSESDTPIAIVDTDLPHIGDVDDNGHLDILTFDPRGGFVYYYRNQATDCGDWAFVLADECWGKFYESGISTSLTLDSVCTTKSSAAKQLHPGSTLLAIDLDGDNDKELILGDVNFNTLQLLTNGGDLNEAYISHQDTLFPSYDVSVDLKSFPAAFSIDIDNDGLKDLLVSPNNSEASEHYYSSWLYNNVGSENEAAFTYNKSTFLIDEMIDRDEGSYPAFVDYNADGLLDLVIGNAGFTDLDDIDYTCGLTPFPQFISSLSLYENTGTAEVPEFTLISNDYLGLAGQLRFLDLQPTFGDLNGDGAVDLLLGTSRPFCPSPSLEGVLIYYENQAGAGEPIQYNNFVAAYQNIDVGQNSSPQIVDVNKDGLNDLIIGNSLGTLDYYENTGTSDNPEFTLSSPVRGQGVIGWGDVDVKDGTSKGYATPFLTDLDDDGNLDLLVGSLNGKVLHYTGIEGNLYEGAFNLVGALDGVRRGERSKPVCGDLDGDGMLELFVGRFNGGLNHYVPMEIVSIDEVNPEKIVIYPNPSGSYIEISFPGIIDQIDIIDIQGRLVHQQTIQSTKGRIELSHLTKGLYFVRVNGVVQKIELL